MGLYVVINYVRPAANDAMFWILSLGGLSSKASESAWFL